MGTRQYIGARYVPKFFEGEGGSIEWVGSNIPYEALVMVTHLNNTYTSKKPVPVGIDITNTEYWALTGNFNSQITVLANEIDDVSDRVTVLENNTLIGKQIAVFGDSYADPNNVFTKWIDDLSEYSGKAVHNNSDSGRTAGSILSAITTDDFVADVYIIECGINDWNGNVTPSTFASNLNNIVTRCRTLNSDCDIMFITPPANLTQLPNYSSVHTYFPLEMYRQVMWTVAQDRYLMVCSGLKMNNFVMGDGLHPQPNTSFIAKAVIRAYESNGDSRDFHNEMANTNATSVERIYINNGKATIRLYVVANFTNGVAHIDNSYINSNNFFSWNTALNFVELAGNCFVLKPLLDSTGIEIRAFRADTGVLSSVSGNLTFGLAFDAMMNGIDTDTAKNNPA